MLLRNLTQLRELHLDWLNISSPLPHALLNLSSLTSLNLFLFQLTRLDLFENNLNGQMQDSLGNSSQLTHLDLSGNNLNVGLSKLTSIILKNNTLNGTILSWLFAQPSLVDIDLSNNKLHGPIPGLVYELQNLTILVFSSNNLSGVVELDKLLNLKYLSYLDLSYNGLALNINNSVNSTFPYFDRIRLASCNLSEFPNFLREQAGLRSLDLSNNKIHGEVSKWIFDVGKDSLYDLNLSHKFLTNNKLTGEIPPLICGLSLAVLDVSNNSLSGLIPQCLGNLSNFLSVLNLGNNRFCGTFTTTFTKGNMLRNLNLNGNQIEGQVPQSLVNCRHLEVLDLGKNKINDTFPHWLGTLRNLQVLVLRFNRFHSHIGTFKTKAKHPFPKLRIIDISCNEFTGLLPTNYIKQFGAMMNVDEHEMQL
ncbi:hypothetical protein ACSBR2_012674 [Camellia fascicularis]